MTPEREALLRSIANNYKHPIPYERETDRGYLEPELSEALDAVALFRAALDEIAIMDHASSCSSYLGEHRQRACDCHLAIAKEALGMASPYGICQMCGKLINAGKRCMCDERTEEEAR